MKILKLQIRNFRGIKSLDWEPSGSYHCLIGPGDSCKSTILDAIEFAHSPRWNLQFDDSDFFLMNIKDPIEIHSTISGFPDEWLKDEKFGLDLRGWGPGGLSDEPLDDYEKVITIRLKVDANLEPTWHVVNDRNPDGRAISARDREKLGVFRLGSSPEAHLSWSRTSALARLTTESDSLSSILADVSRAASEAVKPEHLPNLQAAAAEAQKAAKQVGVEPKETFQAILDVKALSFGAGAIALHDGKIPARRSGLGTRRLLVMGIQRELAQSGGVCLVDEIEHGLEPHRLRRLLRVLRGPKAEGESPQTGQVFVTSHAPIALSELNANELFVVRSTDGALLVHQVPKGLQPIVRSDTEAFLARKVIVCEGKTELGFLRGIDNYLWEQNGESFGLKALAIADGKGRSSGPQKAQSLSGLGYQVLYFGDSDQPLSVADADLTESGVMVVLWADGLAFEERLAQDLSWEGIQALLKSASTNLDQREIAASIENAMGLSRGVLPLDFKLWLDAGKASGKTEPDFRKAIGQASNSGKWFKRVDRAEPLAAIIRNDWSTLKEKDTGAKVQTIIAWAGLRG